MATMLPDINVDEIGFATPGEERFYHFLRETLHADPAILVWYLPSIEGLEADFVLYSPDCGVIVFEVKDWTADRITEATPHSVQLLIGTQVQSRKNPLFQVREYVNALLKRFAKDDILSSRERGYTGRTGIPVSGGVVFPNMTRKDFRDSGFHEVMTDSKILFKEDMAPGSSLCSDPTGKGVREFLQNTFPPLFSFEMTQERLDRLRWVLFPVVRIELPRRVPSLAEAQQHIAILDLAQEQLARVFTCGKRLIQGPSGSGKTLVLTHQASFLKQNCDQNFRILITCYNHSLVNYIRRLLANKQTPYGPDDVEVVPFYELCSRILPERVTQNSGRKGYLQVMRESTLALLRDAKQGQPWRGHYDAIMVDEGQDFMPDMVDILLELLNPTYGIFTMAFDEHQNIYSYNTKWTDHISGIREFTLPNCYRNSVQIGRFAAGKLEHPCDEATLFGPEGPEPKEYTFKDIASLCEYVGNEAASLVRQGCPMSEIAVIYGRLLLKDLEGLPLALHETLEKKGLMATWVAEDRRAKRRYDITTDSITLTTVNSAKGMDYSYVFLVTLPFQKYDSRTTAKNLHYIGMTRAKFGLQICEIDVPQKGQIWCYSDFGMYTVGYL